jgi:hypothetical protein
MLSMATEHECQCMSLPAGWPRCGRLTSTTWSHGCDARTLDRALERLGFRRREDFIEWVATFGPRL